MTKPLDELYFIWLYRQVASDRLKNPSRTYWSLFRRLYSKEFVWLIPNDDNRMEDGRDLRYEFLEEEGLEASELWLNLGCSMFELLIGLSRRLTFEAEGRPREWFWLLLENLKLETYNDDTYMHITDADDIDYILDKVIWRMYDSSGHGGLFPLNHPRKDQRKVELWYQLSAYIQEND